MLRKILICALYIIHCIHGQLLISDMMDLGVYNQETKKYEKTEEPHKVNLGGDDHDFKPHAKSLLGADDHDFKTHKKTTLGTDDHDFKLHHMSLLGSDNHDFKPHKKAILGGDDHDYKHHKKALLGVDDHDFKPHKKAFLGADDHDFKPHKKAMLGGDDHDFKRHSKPLIGSGDHDYKQHNKPLIGGGDHDYKHHAKPLIGGGDHDYKHHGKPLIGGGDHDYKHHGKSILGGDDHDYKHHKKSLIGGDDHDFKKHRKNLLGRDDHDFKLHKKHSSGKNGHHHHHHKGHNKNMIGGGDHDYKKHNIHKMPLEPLPSPRHLEMFKDFGASFNRTYSTQKEFSKRFYIFRSNLRKMKLMQQNERGTAVYGVNKFADLTYYEFQRMLGLRPHLKPAVSLMKKASVPKGDDNAPVEFDWREKGVVTPVKNQGMCGSCWAFSVTGNVEGQYAIKHHALYSLSEQELVDCDDTDEGCNGGMPENAYKAIQDLGGLETEDGYPYEGKDDQCQLDAKKIKVDVNGSVEIPEDEDQMRDWLYHNGPISIGINANALQFYVGGVSHPFKFLCNPDDLDHGMLVVGYGVHTTKYLHRKQPYWLVKNSWGKDWGEKGYYRVYRGDGTCGVNKMATSAIVV